MSTKTLRKRIALVAVSALGAGMLSLVAVPAANAAAGDANAAYAANTLQLATKASTTGSAATNATLASNVSVGLIYQGTGTGTTQTAVMLNTGSLVFYTGAPTTAAVFVADGGTFSSLLATGGSPTPALNSGSTKAYSDATTSTSVIFKPNSGVTSATVYLYTGAATLANPSLGTLVGQIAITVTSSDVSGAYASTYSYLKADNATITASSLASNTDGTTKIVNGGIGYIGVNLNDAFGGTLGNGALIATATNNVIAKWGSTPGSADSNVAVSSTNSYGTLQVKQGAANANKPVTTTVTFTWNGTTVGTKTLTFWGEAAKIDIYNVVTSNLGSANAIGTYVPAGANYKVYDSAGNWIQEPTVQAVAADSTTYTSDVTAVNMVRAADPLAGTPGVGQSGRITWTCATTASGKSATIKLYTLNASNQKVYGSAKLACASDPYTFTATTDKQTYAPGDIITVTFTAKDLYGNLVNDRSEIDASTCGTGACKAVVASGAIASTVDTPSVNDTATNGTWSYRFIATQTEGTYNLSASFPTLSGQAAATLPVTVKSASTSVTNAEVLAAIVKLIASINKQIAALQKALTKKK